MYRVIKYFTDLQDNNHEYNVGDIYPHNKKLLEKSHNRTFIETLYFSIINTPSDFFYRLQGFLNPVCSI